MVTIFYGAQVPKNEVMCQTRVCETRVPKSGRLQNISQIVVKHYIFCQIVVFGHFGQKTKPKKMFGG